MSGYIGDPNAPLTHHGEQLRFEPRTSDPPSTTEGEAWLRVDLASDTHQLATLRFDAGGGTIWDIPVYEVGTSGENVEEVYRLSIGGTVGYIPATTRNPTYPQLGVQHAGSRHGLHNSVETSGLPESAIHRWTFSEGSGSTAVDTIGNADMTLNGVSWESGTWFDDYAGRGDGTDDHGDPGSLGDFGSSMSTDFAIAFTIQTTDTGWPFGWSDGDWPTNYYGCNVDLIASNKIAFAIQDSVNDLRDRIYSSTDINDGNKYRVLWNKKGADATDWELWVNGSEVSVVDQADGATDTIDFNGSFSFWARNDGGTIDQHINAALDNIILFDDSVSESDVQNDYEEQPWVIDPTAIFSSSSNTGSSHMAPVARKHNGNVYAATITGSGTVEIRAYDEADSSLSGISTVDPNNADDNHMGPSVGIDSSGYIHVITGSDHHAIYEVRHFISDNPEDITSFTLENTLPGTTSYRQFLTDGDNFYNFVRSNYSNGRAAGLVESSDAGTTWSISDHIRSDGNWMYPRDAVRDGDVFHVLHSRRASNSDANGTIYYQFDRSTGDVLGPGGSTYSPPITNDSTLDSANMAVKTGDHAWASSMGVDSGTPVVIWWQDPDSDGVYDLEFARWDGSSWQQTNVVSDYTNDEGVTPHVPTQLTWIEVDGTDQYRIITTYPIREFGADAVDIFETVDGGATWSSDTATIDTSLYSATDPWLRPQVVADHGGTGAQYVMYENSGYAYLYDGDFRVVPR